MNTYLAEFIGTCFLVLMGNGVVAGAILKNSKAAGAGWVAICLGWGLAVTFAIYAVGDISGAHLNPAVTLGLAIAGDFEWGQVPFYMLAQLSGAFLGAVLVYIHYLPHWKGTEDPETKLAAFATGPAIKATFSNLLSETIGTFILIFGLLFIGANQFTEGLNPLVVGALIALIGFSLGGTTGWAINPARDLGPRIAHYFLPIHGKGSSHWNYAWIPIIGPLYGGASGAIVYNAVFNNGYGWAFWGVVGVFLAISIREIIRSKK
ncbi:MAG: aquaporin family protein [Cyclobacteriaceae bacterium]|nr:aquaporin family protein [Cyclobacteriaceae bacterium]